MARISEIHYSNTHASSTGIGEFFEVALAPGENPADFFVSTYNENGNVFIDIALTTTGITSSVDPDTGETIYVIAGATFGFVLTDPDGGGSNNEAVALTDVSGPTNVVIDFYDVGGGTTAIEASNGAAAGATSTNLAGDFGASIQFNQPNPNTPVFGTANPGDAGILCFVAGTVIQTQQGDVPVEQLAAGDQIVTLDNGLQPIRWIGSRRVSGVGRFAPYRISAGHFGAKSDVWLSPAHRVLVTDWRAQMFFGQPQVLAAANMLQNHPGVSCVPQDTVTYYHMLFDEHQIVLSDGLASESFFPGPYALSTLEAAAQEEVLTLFPELAHGSGAYGQSSRTILRAFEVDMLLAH